MKRWTVSLDVAAPESLDVSVLTDALVETVELHGCVFEGSYSGPLADDDRLQIREVVLRRRTTDPVERPNPTRVIDERTGAGDPRNLFWILLVVVSRRLRRCRRRRPDPAVTPAYGARRPRRTIGAGTPSETLSGCPSGLSDVSGR